MSDLRAFVRRFSMSGWRGLLCLALFVAILVTLPQARALLTAGCLGGIILGVFLIMIRQQPSGPRRGTPIVLFPRPVTQVSDLLSRSHVSSARIFA